MLHVKEMVKGRGKVLGIFVESLCYSLLQMARHDFFPWEGAFPPC